MAAATESPYTQEQIKVWLRGLLTVAWADGHFDAEEQQLITTMMEEELAPCTDFEHFEPVTAAELQTALGQGECGENFLRMAVMVALADGIYSTEEDAQLRQFCTSLQLDPTALDAMAATLVNPAAGEVAEHDSRLDPLKPARTWLDQLEVQDPRLARFVCKLIPSQCPFERDITLFGKKVVHIPPMCKLNPLYEQLVGLRFRALSYLADDCGEDVTPFI